MHRTTSLPYNHPDHYTQIYDHTTFATEAPLLHTINYFTPAQNHPINTSTTTLPARSSLLHQRITHHIYPYPSTIHTYENIQTSQ